ncbi:MAG: hypothetical protein V4864_05885 [Pseudomonadota bacterium]
MFRTLASILVAALLLAACGGGSGSSPLPAPDTAVRSATPAMAPANAWSVALSSRTAPPMAAADLSATQLFDWAEWAYPALFPSHEADAFADPYQYRFYPATGNHVGVAGGAVYLLGPASGGVLQSVGRMQDFACAVRPETCSAAVPGVSVTLESPAGIYEAVRTGDIARLAHIPLRLDGNLALLSRVYLLVEDPQGLFALGTSLGYFTPTGFDLHLILRPQATPGARSGSLRLHVCLDAGCTTRAPNTPLTVPYTVDVLENIALPPVSFSGLAYQAGTTQSVTFALPRHTASWRADWYQDRNGWQPVIAVRTETSADGATGTIRLDPLGTDPGVHTGTVRVGAVVRPPNGTEYEINSEIKVTYTVTGERKVYWFTPDHLEFTIPASQITTQGILTDFSYSWSFSADLRWVATEYLSAPAAAATHPLRENWCGISTLQLAWGTDGALPPGTYTARHVFELTDLGVKSTLYVPVTLTITP